MKLLQIFTLFMACIMPAFADNHDLGPNVIRIHGSTTVYENVVHQNARIIGVAYGVEFIPIDNGSTKGLEDLREGLADVAMLSAPLKEVGAKVFEGESEVSDYEEFYIGETSITFSLHPKNPVTKLSKEQIQGILLGKITNWSQVGGKDLPIKVYIEKTGGVRSVVVNEALNGQPIKAANLYEQVTSKIAMIAAYRDEASFAVISNKMERMSSLKPIEAEFKISQPLYFITKGTPSSRDMKIFETFKMIYNEN